ncbi:MAG TPA: UDP-N-acetylmuramoyl-L-alanyl-D-glutamate--2,6-diaminopimelate ligase [Spirochaetia bacterium]|nr:UDP-N-acetylmuramoyl-L-alanyl-D-glutamate--2,6-diaminopimelate ligase [Spirochaetia bacterium]
MREIPLRALLSAVRVRETRGDLDRRVRGIAYDSREVEPGYLFAAMDGVHADGHQFIPSALSRGASVIVHSKPLSLPAGEATFVRLENPRRSLSPIAAEFFGHPSRNIRVIGVTGTDGKSSTVWFITRLLGLLGKKAGFLSTVSFQTGEEIVKNPFRQSTPEASEIHGMLRDMADQGREYAVIEATSHGLSERMNRLGDVVFDAAVLTNVTHEHLEFHGTFEQYRSDKANLFRSLSPSAEKTEPSTGAPIPVVRFGVVNADDPSADYVRSCCRVPVASYGLGAGADLAARNVKEDLTGTSFSLVTRQGEAPGRIAIPGPFWVSNALAACLAVSRSLDVDPLSLAPLLSRLPSVKGRMDPVDRGQPFTVIVDYAHTPGAFEKLFPWVRANARGRITAVFGSAGERDRAKRPMQGRVAGTHCDTLVITDEDPRGEDRMQILEQIAAGCPQRKRGTDLFLIPDRREAIAFALGRACPGDVVLLLGKGHEGSIIGPSGPAEWDERTEAEKALHALGFGS